MSTTTTPPSSVLSTVFRILVIGRANAGKTTLLKKVCNSIENPEIFDPEGNRIDATIVEGSMSRGMHDIENQLFFKSDPRFIFHDSSGFESGSNEQMDKVKTFIRQRARSTKFLERLDAIWYCLPTDTNRPLLHADTDFFGSDLAGGVPVIVVLTKSEAVDSYAFQDLLRETKDVTAARALVGQKAQDILHTRFIGPLKSMAFPPADCVIVKKLHRDGDCKELIMKTAEALSTGDVLPATLLISELPPEYTRPEYTGDMLLLTGSQTIDVFIHI
ncbi:era-like GTP-binding protein [Mycena amicta]|nr:era-like GTP-binding protein [Mycena amicta]